MIEKNGMIGDDTPSEQPSTQGCNKPSCCRRVPEKQANDSRTDHAATRAADAVANASRRD